MLKTFFIRFFRNQRKYTRPILLAITLVPIFIALFLLNLREQDMLINEELYWPGISICFVPTALQFILMIACPVGFRQLYGMDRYFYFIGAPAPYGMFMTSALYESGDHIHNADHVWLNGKYKIK